VWFVGLDRRICFNVFMPREDGYLHGLACNKGFARLSLLEMSINRVGYFSSSKDLYIDWMCIALHNSRSILRP